MSTVPSSRSPGNVRIGIIGATSFVAQAAVIPAINNSPKIDLVAMASRHAGTLPRRNGVRIFNSYEELMASDDIDAVYIPIPNALHGPAVKFALSNKKHVLCEKPLAISETEAKELAEYAVANQLILMEAYMTHYHPRNKNLMGVVSARSAIKVRHIHAGFTGTLDKRDDFRWQTEMGGGSLRDVGVYLISPILEAAGTLPESVYGQATFTDSGVDESFAGLLSFEDGMTASIFSSFASGEGQYLRFNLEKGRISVTNAFTPTLDDNLFEVSNLDGKIRRFESKPANCYLEMINHFCDLVANNAPPLRSLTTTVQVQRVIDHLLLSAKERRVVNLDAGVPQSSGNSHEGNTGQSI